MGELAAVRPPVRFRDLPRSRRWCLVAFVVAATAASVVGLLRHADQGLAPIGDTAVITQTSLTALEDRPLLGQGSTADLYGNPFTRHPGPLQFYLGAPFLRALGPTAGGYAFAVATGLTASFIAGWVALRRAGFRGAVLYSVGAAVVAATVLEGRLASMNITYIGVLPLFATMVCAWAVADEDWTVLPFLVLVASFIAQTETVYIAPALPVVLTGVAVGLSRWWRRGRSPRAIALPAVAASSLALLLWSPPAYDQLFESHNFGLLLSADIPMRGWSGASRALGTLWQSPAWVLSMVSSDAMRPVGLGSLLVVALVVALLAWQRERTARHRGLLAVVAAVMVGAAAGGAVLPDSDSMTWHLLWLPCGAVFVWTSLLLVFLEGRSLPRVAPAIAVPVVATVLIASSFLTAATPFEGPSPEDSAARLVTDLTPSLVRAVPAGRATSLLSRGPFSDSIGPGLALQLTGRGRPAYSYPSPERIDPQASVLVVTRGGARVPDAELVGSRAPSMSRAQAEKILRRIGAHARSHGPIQLDPAMGSEITSMLDGTVDRTCVDELLSDPSAVAQLPDRSLAQLYVADLVRSPLLPGDLDVTANLWLAGLGAEVWALEPGGLPDPPERFVMSTSDC